MKRLTVSAAFFFLVAITFCDAAFSVDLQNVEITLVPEYDLIGDQIEVIQGFYMEGESPAMMNTRVAFGIYDTGASVVTLSAADQESFGTFLTPPAPVPIKSSGGAFAEGVGGNVTGDVSQPGYVVSDGMHVFDFSTFAINFNVQSGGTQTRSAVAPGVQMFVGTATGSDSLPTISGTPIHHSQTHNNAAAAHISKEGYTFNLQTMFPDLITTPIPYSVPDLKYVDSGTKLIGSADTTAPIRIPLTLIGENNRSNPENQITAMPNPFVTNVRAAMGTDPGAASSPGRTYLFDTGAMMSLISTGVAEDLKLDLTKPTRTLDVVGAAGQTVSISGYDVPLLELAYDNLDGTKGYLQLKDVPVFVLNVGAGIDGILGMNLFNTAKEMLYDPNDPAGASLQLTFSTGQRVFEEDLASLTDSNSYTLFRELSADYGEAFTSMFVRVPYIPSVTSVPEPGTLVLLALGAALFLLRRSVRTPARSA